MKSRLFLLGLFVVLLSSARAQDSLTVKQAIEEVLSTHPTVNQSMQQVQAAEARWQQSTSVQLPEITAEGFYTRIGPIAELSIPMLGDFKLYPENNYDGHIGARYTVFDFGRTNASIDLSESRVQSARDAVEITKTGLVYQTIRTFYSILFLQQSIDVQKEQIEALNQHLDITKKKANTGTATDFDVLTTQVRVAAAQQQKIELENAVQKQQSVLRQLLGIPSTTALLLKGDFEAFHDSISTDSLVEHAFEQRPEMAFVRDAILTADLQSRFASLVALPSIKLNATYGVKNGYIPNLDTWRGNWVAGVKLEIPIYEGGRARNQEQEAQALYLAEQEHLRDVELQIRSDIEQVVADVKAAKEKLKIAGLQVQQAEAAVGLARLKYETGSMTNLDLLDSETAESAAKLGQLHALYKYVISRYELQRAIGEPML
ncbi:MAG: TolC family protein [Bacteroidota bacterium]